jgi:hypothetical protein
VKHEWQIDKIAAASTNNQVAEGTNGSNTAVTPTSRIFNYTEIPTYTFQVSGTAQAMNTAGRANELSLPARDVRSSDEARHRGCGFRCERL